MKKKSLIWAFALCACALALADPPPCNYSIPEYGGTPCNELPPPPPVTQAASPCSYYFCDENYPCGSTWMKTERYRDIRKAGESPVQYYQGNVIDDTRTSICCYCTDGNGDPEN